MTEEKIKWGADPEFFSAYEIDGNKYVLPPVILRADYGFKIKENGRHPIFAEYGETFVHEDGAAFEMSTPPSNDWRKIWSTVNDAKDSFSKDVLSKFPDVCLPQLFSLPAMNYHVSRWMDRGPEFHLATIFGCDPDHDVYRMQKRCEVLDASEHPWRYAGGHIHASGLQSIIDKPLQAVRSMVITAGVAATAYTDVPDLEKERLYLYGRPGKFRIQKYSNGEAGIEYRTPSTRWTEIYSLAEKIFSWAEIGLMNLLKGGLLEEIAHTVEEDAKDAILSVDKEKAVQILDFISEKI